MAWGRQLEVLIGPADPINVIGSETKATRISDLDMSFNIVRSNQAKANKANFKIYNTSKQTRDEILKVDNNILVYAGYEDEGNKRLIYAGNISEVNTEKDGPDTVTSIKAITYRAKNKNEGTVNLSLAFSPEEDMEAVLKELATLLGLNLRGASNTSGIKLANGFHFIGTSMGAIAYCKRVLERNQLSILVDNNDMLIFRPGYIFSKGSYTLLDSRNTANEVYGDSSIKQEISAPDKIPPQRPDSLGTIETPLLSYGNSLLKVEETSKGKTWVSKLQKNTTGANKKKLTLSTLLDPVYAPQGGLLLDTEDYGGVYVINSVNFYGDNYGGDFNCKLMVQSID
jgi:hypothetical protein